RDPRRARAADARAAGTDAPLSGDTAGAARRLRALAHRVEAPGGQPCRRYPSATELPGDPRGRAAARRWPRGAAAADAAPDSSHHRGAEAGARAGTVATGRHSSGAGI